MTLTTQAELRCDLNNSRQLLINISVVLVGAMLASGIFLLLSGERGWVKFAAWVIFFTAIQSPFFLTKSSDQSCSILARLKRRS
ncbi:MAG TPA: hypothetical protein VF131_16370 [Blastocatellia bacterium]|nr:hypothetical protein [Blastocatellia bacterium]